MKKFIILACTFVMSFALCACGSGASSSDSDSSSGTESSGSSGSSSVTIKKNGSVELELVEDFGAEYSEDDLESMLEASITSYKKKSSAAEISLKSCEKDSSGQLAVKMEFDSSESYAGWNNYFLDYMYAQELGIDADTGVDTDGFFAGTISEAYSAGYSLDVTLSSVSDSSSVSKSDLLGMSDKHIVIMEYDDDEETLTVNCFGEILYVSDSVSLAGKKSAGVSASDEKIYIIFE